MAETSFSHFVPLILGWVVQQGAEGGVQTLVCARRQSFQPWMSSGLWASVEKSITHLVAGYQFTQVAKETPSSLP